MSGILANKRFPASIRQARQLLAALLDFPAHQPDHRLHHLCGEVPHLAEVGRQLTGIDAGARFHEGHAEPVGGTDPRSLGEHQIELMYLTCSTTESRSQHFGPDRQRGALSPRQYTIVYCQRHHGNRNEKPTVATHSRPVAADPAWQPDIRRLAACGGGMICRRREELFGGLGYLGGSPIPYKWP